MSKLDVITGISVELESLLQEMFESCKCTYRVTRTHKGDKQRLMYKVDMHWQHKRKALSIRQKGLKARCKKKPSPLMKELRNKKTNCPSTLTLKIMEPTKKELHCNEKDVLLLIAIKARLASKGAAPLN